MTPSDDVPSSECHGISLSMFQDHSWGCMSMIDPLGLSLCIHIRSQEPGEHSGDHMICFAYHKLLLSYSLCEVTLTSLMKHRVDDATSSTLQTNYPLRGRLRSTPTYHDGHMTLSDVPSLMSWDHHDMFHHDIMLMLTP